MALFFLHEIVISCYFNRISIALLLGGLPYETMVSMLARHHRIIPEMWYPSRHHDCFNSHGHLDDLDDELGVPPHDLGHSHLMIDQKNDHLVR